MSGSWNKNTRKLIEEVRNTLQMHFSGITVSQSNLALNAYNIHYETTIPTQAYGGVLFQRIMPTTTPDYQVHSPQLISFPTAIACHTSDNASALHQVSTTEVACFSSNSAVIQTEYGLNKTPKLHQLPIMAFTAHEKSFGPGQLTFSKKRVTHRIKCSTLNKPRVRQKRCLNKARIQRGTPYAISLPICKKPIPPHRFPRETRQYFRQRLAEKTDATPADIQITAIFDRLDLNAYQTLSQAPDGTLLCYPKPRKDRGKSTQPAYLIIGKSLKQPQTLIQTAIPMEEVSSHDD